MVGAKNIKEIYTFVKVRLFPECFTKVLPVFAVKLQRDAFHNGMD